MGLEKHLERLRKAEIEAIQDWFQPKMRVLEIGGGSGYQASLLASYGCDVHSIDLSGRSVLGKKYYVVADYDGQKIPFSDQSFDLIFSSNVLEHIESLGPVFEEIRRVLKPKGKIIHLLPSTSWRFWTSVAHYAYLLKCLLCRKVETMGKTSGIPIRSIAKKYTLPFLLKRGLIAGAHGIYPNALLELYYFSRFRWLVLFKKNGFDLLKVSDNGLFYTGYGVCHSLSLKVRRKMARFMGASCHIFVMRVR